MLGLSAGAGIHLIGSLTLALFDFSNIPMTVIAEKGHVYKGELTVSIPASFQFSDGRVTCSGDVPSFIAGDSESLTVPFTCNGKSKGIAIFTDIYNLRNGGGGIVRFSDGTSGTFITGDGAAAF